MDERISVLLVERDPQSAQLLILLLAAPDARGFETARVEGVEEGLRRLDRGERADAVLLGLPLAEGRLRERLRALRRRAPEVPVVVAVDPGDEALGREAMALGAESFWVRSANAGSLKRAVAAAGSALPAPAEKAAAPLAVAAAL